jgi:hypothetical protein
VSHRTAGSLSTVGITIEVVNGKTSDAIVRAEVFSKIAKSSTRNERFGRSVIGLRRRSAALQSG